MKVRLECNLKIENGDIISQNTIFEGLENELPDFIQRHLCYPSIICVLENNDAKQEVSTKELGEPVEVQEVSTEELGEPVEMQGVARWIKKAGAQKKSQISRRS